ncbi:unnamed protein product, partial [Medioppia subpectinata]
PLVKSTAFGSIVGLGVGGALEMQRVANREVGRAYNSKTYWAKLELTTYDRFSDEIQSVMSGILEGYITGELIHMNYRNNIEGLCDKRQRFCELLKQFKENNTKFVEEMIAKNKNNDYWHQLDLIYKQINGLEAGYHLWKVQNDIKNTTESQYLSEIFWINVGSEMYNLERILTPDSTTLRYRDHCSAIVKPLADGSDLFVAHNTWSGLETMLRVMKRYSFAFNTVANKTKKIAGHSVSFSSSPGFIFSGDDYYVLSSKLVVQETTNHNYNQSLYQHIRADNILFEFIRNVVANRLADSGKEWTDLFAQYNSGTYNNQFMIVDYKLFKKGTKGYWASYNVPYFKDIYDRSGNAEEYAKLGPFYSYNDTARALIFRRDQSKIVDLKTLFSLMRYNDFKKDPLSECRIYNKVCVPPYSADLSIAARNDLNDVNGKYPIDGWAHRAEGATDAKMTNSSMVEELELLAVSGPTDQQQPPFQWSKSGFKNNHFGQPDSNHVRCLNDFVTAQIAFYARCNQHMCDLQRELSTGANISSIRGHVNDLTSPSDDIKPTLPPGKRYAKALYDYDSKDGTELSLLANEVIIVSQSVDLDADWMQGERGAQKGRVPLAYLEILN